ncbi:MAG: hypothetical protein KC944_23645, partial [Candidatus Omnitrophica bacterium]|nr:hypothetical protein [Candidatus Omnitrophota bacterium]
MRLKIRKRVLAEFYSGASRLWTRNSPGARIDFYPGGIRATGTNYKEALVYETESPENEDNEGTIFVPPDSLKEIVSSYGDDALVEFEKEDEGRIRAEWEAKGLSSTRFFREGMDLPEIKIPDAKSFKSIDRERFRSEYSICATCTSQERSRFSLDCIALDGENGKMTATDGRQVYETSGVRFLWKDCCYLPVEEGFPEKMLFSSGDLEIAKSKKIVALRNGLWTYAVRLKETDFPPIDKVSLDLGDTELVLQVSEGDAERMMELLPHLPGKSKELSVVKLIAEERIVFQSESSDGDGEADGRFELLSSHWIGEKFEVRFNRLYFLRALEHGFRTFRFLPGNAPIIAETQSRRYLFMPLLVHEEEGAENAEVEPEVHRPRGNPPAPAPTPVQVRKRRNQW